MRTGGRGQTDEVSSGSGTAEWRGMRPMKERREQGLCSVRQASLRLFLACSLGDREGSAKVLRGMGSWFEDMRPGRGCS